ncbi:MAG: hypothetical protein ACKVW3_04690 [Phycisphaerales bacterium]
MGTSMDPDLSAAGPRTVAEGYLDVLRLQSEDLRRLRTLEAASKSPGEERRWEPRGSRAARALADFTGPTGVHSKAVVYPFDVSRTGIGFLHAAYLHNGTKVRLRLWFEDQESIVVEGAVRRCRFLTGRAHAVGVEFTSPLPDGILGAEPGAACSPSQEATPKAAPAPGDSQAPPAVATTSPEQRDAHAQEMDGLVGQLLAALDVLSQLGASIRSAAKGTPEAEHAAESSSGAAERAKERVS